MLAMKVQPSRRLYHPYTSDETARSLFILYGLTRGSVALDMSSMRRCPQRVVLFYQSRPLRRLGLVRIRTVP